MSTAQKSETLDLAATQAQEDAPVGFAWSGWACMYPGKLPRLYGALEIASVNLDAANGDRLIHLSTSPDPKAQEDRQISDQCLMDAVLNCPHSIAAESVTLRFSQTQKEGHNALSQLRHRLADYDQEARYREMQLLSEIEALEKLALANLKQREVNNG